MVISIILVVGFLAVITMFSLDRSWNNVTLDKRNDLVFEKKNKEYGAFVIRKGYNRTVITALAVSCAFAVIATAGPVFLNGADDENQEKVVTMDQVKLVEPPPVKEEEVLPPPPPPPPPPPMIKQIQFTEPEVTEEEVKEIPPPQEEITSKIGDFNQEGEDLPVAPIDPGEGVGGQVEQVYTFAEVMPSFPGGDAALQAYLAKNINYPSMEQSMDISGVVVLSFKVDKNGEVSEVKELKGVKGGPNLTKEAIRVVKTMPKWSPGKMNGKAVPVIYNLPVRFTLK